MTTADTISQVIHRPGCVIRVMGYRSTKGWDVTRHDGEVVKHQGHRKKKADAIQLAEDACEPGVAADFTVKPTEAK